MASIHSNTPVKFLQPLIAILLMAFMVGCNTEKNQSEKDQESKKDTVDKQEQETKQANKTQDVQIGRISTQFGDILIWLYDATPKHKKNFLKLASKGFYDSTTFHRVIDGFMIQGGDPNTKTTNPSNVGKGGPGYKIEAEIKDGLKHDYGAVAAAREGDRVNPERKSSGSQFYIVENKQGTPQLDGKYTVFGKVITGMDVVEKIAEQPTDQNDQPKEPIRMKVNVLETTPKKLNELYDFRPPQIQ